MTKSGPTRPKSQKRDKNTPRWWQQPSVWAAFHIGHATFWVSCTMLTLSHFHGARGIVGAGAISALVVFATRRFWSRLDKPYRPPSDRLRHPPTGSRAQRREAQRRHRP